MLGSARKLGWVVQRLRHTRFAAVVVDAAAAGDVDLVGMWKNRGIRLAGGLVAAGARRCRGERRDRAFGGFEAFAMIAEFAEFGGFAASRREVFGGRGRPWR